LGVKIVRARGSIGTICYGGLVAVFTSATGLSVVRWAEDYHLLVLGALALEKD
jgi:hypothetical protein